MVAETRPGYTVRILPYLSGQSLKHKPLLHGLPHGIQLVSCANLQTELRKAKSYKSGLLLLLLSVLL